MSSFNPETLDELPPEDGAHTIRLACEYFMDLGWPKSVPRRADVEPADMVAFLPYVNLVQVIWEDEEIADFRYRVVGTKQVENAQTDISWKTVAEAFDEPFRTPIFLNMMSCATGPNVVRYKTPMPHQERGHIASDRVYLPLLGNGSRVEFILQAHGYDEQESKKTPFQKRPT